MCGFNGTNSISRALVNESFEFEILHPNTLLVEEGTRESRYLYVILSGKIDIRRKLNAKKNQRFVDEKLYPRSKNIKKNVNNGLYGDIV